MALTLEEAMTEGAAVKAVGLDELRRWRAAFPQRPLVLHGAGDLGKLAFHALAQAGIGIAAFCDGSPLKWGRFYRNIPIISPAELAAYHRDTRIVISHNYLATAVPALREMGFRDLCQCGALFDGVDFTGADVDVHSLEIQRKIAWHRRECGKDKSRGGALVLKYIDLVITEACTMRCVDCANLMQYYQHPRNADMEIFATGMNRLMEAVDWIDELRVLGGEPFLNKRLAEILETLGRHRNFQHLVIYTNGTLLPPPGALETLRDKRVTVNITDYGQRSRRLAELVAALAAAGVAYLVKTPCWTDSGRIRHRPRPAEQLDAMFANCCVNDVLTLLNGVLYRCPFSANGTNLGAVPTVGEDSVAVTEIEDVERLRGEIRRLYSRTTHVKACEYCSGRDYTTPKIEAAVQVRRPLDLPTDASRPVSGGSP